MRRRRALRQARLGRSDTPPLAAPGPHLALRRANVMMETEDFGSASILYERLAREARENGVRQAPFLYLQAGRACALAGRIAPCMNLLQQGLSMLSDSGRWTAFKVLSERAARELSQLNFLIQAQQVETWAKEQLQAAPAFQVSASALSPQPNRAARFPALCPACGAPLRPDEIEWLGEVYLECAYCGTPISLG